MKHPRLATIAICTLMAARGVAAQEAHPAGPAGPPIPTRVRLTMTDGSRLKADLLQVEKGRLIVRTTERISEERSIVLTDVKRAQLIRGRQRQSGKGALWGCAVGGVGGLVPIGAAEDDLTPATIAFGLLIYCSMGAGVGAGVGALIKTDRWEDIPVSSLSAASGPAKADPNLPAASPDRQMGFSIGPTIDRGVQARFSISWR